MKKNPFGILLFTLIAAFTCLGFVILNKSNTKKTVPADQTGSIVKAANAFLNALSAEQRAKIAFAFTQQKAAVAAKFARTNTPGGPGGRRKAMEINRARRKAAVAECRRREGHPTVGAKADSSPALSASSTARPYGRITR
ncbi:hypothetical protein [Mucilaginibacter pineti]|uniref:hypothetical protein n=1 Tax=Mucilaginibacter pineti TaxID=1391627 RepID=UPI000B89DBED|nr:hypothetical protein [Mucilaginibacter pineti]